ncbi:helix-turn-helix domain-containing protein [Streptomyces sp. NPDC127190]|uniref:helix-turn-helix domain-containing protein n=1 Tax=unclassified Streptomyces TaxID=2593676 RepID=UPI00362CE034
MADESRELAALLLALKERSGRSYGMLAKRLHVGTSTLHRYCNGTTVANEYAPLERFARVCGATPEELVELHRRWILADAARGRAAETPRPADADTRGGEHADADAAVVPADPVTDLPPRPRMLPRRRTAVVAAAAVVLCAAAAAAATRFTPESGTAAASGETRGASAQAAERHPATHPTPTAPRRTTASPSASAGAGTPSPSARTEPPARRTTAADSAPPFHVNVLTNNWDSPCDQWFLLNSGPRSVPPPPASQATDGWAAALHAVPAGHLRLQVTVQGTSSRPVVLHTLRVVTTSSRTAPTGNAYMMGAGCGGGLNPASFAVDLDSPSANPRPMPGEGGTTNFPYKVSVDDPEVLDIDASTNSHDVGWYLELTWSSGDRQGRTRIDDHGQPFRTVAMRGDKAYWYNGADGAGAWQPYPGADASGPPSQ